MSIIQISKIQQRSGNLVDLPQLDQAELGFAADVSRLFIGKTEGNIENIEVLTAYSDISFSQINGAVGNLNIGNDVADGQVLVFDGTNWVNRGGNVGGYVDLGHVSNIAISGGGIDYVLTTDGTGNLSWTPKSTIVAFIANVTQANPGVVTCTEDIFLVNGAGVTITSVNGMTELNGQSYYIGNLTNNSFALYSDITLANTIDTTGYTAYSSGGKIASAVGGSEGSANAAGANTELQFNYNNLLYAVPNLTYDFANNLLVLTGTANINNVNISGNLTAANANIGNLISNVGNLIIYGGNAGDVLTTYGNGTVYWDTAGSFATVTTTNITTGSPTTPGTITGNWTLTSGSQLQATYADLAEYYAADNAYASGTVLEFGGNEEVTLAGAESNKIAGVVSEHPAYVLNSNIQATHPVMIALIGRTPVQVTGTVNKGDMLVSAGNGHAKASNDPKLGTVIGKAIENKTSEEPGLVEVMVGRL